MWGAEGGGQDGARTGEQGPPQPSPPNPRPDLGSWIRLLPEPESLRSALTSAATAWVCGVGTWGTSGRNPCPPRAPSRSTSPEDPCASLEHSSLQTNVGPQQTYTGVHIGLAPTCLSTDTHDSSQTTTDEPVVFTPCNKPYACKHACPRYAPQARPMQTQVFTVVTHAYESMHTAAVTHTHAPTDPWPRWAPPWAHTRAHTPMLHRHVGAHTQWSQGTCCGWHVCAQAHNYTHVAHTDVPSPGWCCAPDC